MKSVGNLSMFAIYSYIPEVISSVRNNEISVLVAPTGSGKTLAVPPAFARLGKRIMVVVPKVQYATSGIKNIDDIYQGEFRTGYAAGGKRNFDYNDQIVFVTAGYLKRRLLSLVKHGKCADIDFTDILFIDEAHEMTIDLFTIFNILKHCLYSGNPDLKMPKILLASATVDLAMFPEANPVIMPPKDTKPVEILYHNKDYTANELKKADSIIYKDLAQKIVYFHENFKNDKNMMSFLIFSPGTQEMINLNKAIDEIYKEKDIKVYKVYAGSLQEEIDDAISETLIPGMRRIIIGTNFVEASVTIENLTMVFDMMFSKVTFVNSLGGKSLDTVYESKASAGQRKGRVGRRMEGTVYRLCTKNFFDVNLQEQIKPEIMRTPLEEVLMDLYSIGLEPIELIKRNLSIEQFEEMKENLIRSRDLIFRLGLVKEDKKLGIIVTQRGFWVKNLRLPVRLGYLLYVWNELGLDIYQGLIICSLLASFMDFPVIIPSRIINQNKNFQIINQEKLAFTKKVIHPYMGETSFITLLNLYNKYVEKQNDNSWAADNDLNFSFFETVKNNINDNIKSLKLKDKKLIKLNPEKIIPISHKVFIITFFDTIVSRHDKFYTDTTKTMNYKLINHFANKKTFENIIPLIVRSGRDNNILLFVDVGSKEDIKNFVKDNSKISNLFVKLKYEMRPENTIENLSDKKDENYIPDKYKYQIEGIKEQESTITFEKELPEIIKINLQNALDKIKKFINKK